jgi:alpha-tubulin suppressor-like RCC1 family protein
VSGFHILPGLSGIQIVKVVASAVACHYVAISSDGVAYVWGRNENGQLGTGNMSNVYLPSAVSAVTGVIDAAVGKGHTLLLTRSGSLWAAGATNKGQCGVGRTSETPVLSWTPCRISGIVKVAAGNEFSLCCDKDGRLYSCGSKENGQTGLGKTGERIETAGKLTFDLVHTFVMHQTGEIFGQKVIDVSCGAVHGACLTDVGTVYTWGCGGFGRLGHKNVEEQLLPNKVAFFGDRPDRKCRLVSCGASCTYFTCGQKEMVRRPTPPPSSPPPRICAQAFAPHAPQTAVYMCGILAKTGEANTYPKPIQELSGWSVRSVSAGPQSTIVAAADALVSWGNSPMVGELG